MENEGSAMEAVLSASDKPHLAFTAFAFNSMARSELSDSRWCISLPCALTIKVRG
jgi:hypothetical protein